MVRSAVLQRTVAEVRHRHRRPHSHRPSGDQIDRTPQSHILVRRAGIPVDPVDAQVFLCRRGCLDRQHVGLTRFEHVRHVEIVGAISARDGARIRYLFPIEPDLAAIVDSAEVEPEAAIGRPRGRKREFLSIPPAAAIRAICRHRQIREIGSDGIACSGNLAKIVTEVGIGNRSCRDLRCQHGAWNRGLQPSFGGKASARNGLTGRLDLAGRLEAPALVQGSHGCCFERHGARSDTQDTSQDFFFMITRISGPNQAGVSRLRESFGNRLKKLENVFNRLNKGNFSEAIEDVKPVLLSFEPVARGPQP